MYRGQILRALRVSVLLSGGLFSLRAGVVEDACTTGTWANCGNAVKHELDRNPADPKLIIHLGILWGRSFGVQYDFLRRQGRIEMSTPDAEKIFEEVSSKLNPLDVAKDKVIDELVKHYLPLVAPVLEWANKPLVEAFKVFFSSSEIASDYDELRLMNDAIQRKTASLLGPFLKPDWEKKLRTAVEAASPQLRKL